MVVDVFGIGYLIDVVDGVVQVLHLVNCIFWSGLGSLVYGIDAVFVEGLFIVSIRGVVVGYFLF